jgi:transposase
MLQMAQINKIKKLHNTQDKSTNEIANQTNISWATAKKYIKATSEEIDKMGTRNRQRIVTTDEVVNRITQLIDDEIATNVPRKQRYTSYSIHKLLKSEGIYKGSARQLRKTVKIIREEHNQLKKQRKAYLELSFKHGYYLQLDHGEATISLNGQSTVGYMFTASVPGLILRYCQFYLTKDGLAWADFHERAFQYYGGIFETCIYDNDTALVKASIKEPTKIFNDVVGHYGFKYILCNRASGWEKGQVENSVGYCRRNFLTGIPEFVSMIDINIHLDNKSREDVNTNNHYETGIPLSQGLDVLKNTLQKLRPEHHWVIADTVIVSSQQTVSYKEYKYSVPEQFIGSQIKINVSIFSVFLYDNDDKLICVHPRLYQGNNDSLLLEHFYDQLERKPGAFNFAKVVQDHCFSDELQSLRSRLLLIPEKLKNHPNTEFIKILTLQRNATVEEFESAIQLSLSYGGITYDAIKSMIQLLKIDQQPMVYSSKTLPKEYQINIDQDFNLEAYRQLYQQEYV